MEIDYRQRLAWGGVDIDDLFNMLLDIVNCQCDRCHNFARSDNEQNEEESREEEACRLKPFVINKLVQYGLSYECVDAADTDDFKIFNDTFVDRDVHVLIEDWETNYKFYIGNRLYGQPFEQQLGWFQFWYDLERTLYPDRVGSMDEFLYGKPQPEYAKPNLRFNSDEEWEVASYEGL